MLKLLIDTATQVGTIALYDKDKLLSQITFNERLRHLKILHSGIEDLLSKHNKNTDDINLVGVDIGPGSFTGIRIGVTTARTIAQLNNCYIEGITSLEILNNKIDVENFYVCPLLDAKKNRVFSTLFFNNERKIEYLDVSIEKLIDKIKKEVPDEKIIFLGDGLEKYEEILKKVFTNSIFKDKTYFYPEAEYIHNRLKNKSDFNLKYENIKPFYIRKSDAEESGDGG